MLFVSSVSPDGRSMLLDIKTGTIHRTYKSDPIDTPFSVSYSPKTSVFFVPQDKPCLYQFSPSMQQAVHRSFSTEKIMSSTVSPCGNTLICGGENGSVFIWNIMTGELLRLVKCHIRQVHCIAFSNDGSQFCTSSADSTCKIWSLGTLLSSTQFPTADVTFTAHTLAVTGCSFLHHGCSAVTCSLDRSIKMFDTATGAVLMSVTVDVPLTSLAVSGDEQYLVCGGQQGNLFFMTLQQPCSSSSEVGFSITRDHSWMPDLRRCPPSAGGHTKNIVYLTFLTSSQGCTHVLVVSENGVALIWDAVSLKVLQTVITIKKGICSAFFVPHLDPDVAASLKHDVAVNFGKYPVDPLGQIGYVIPAISGPQSEADAKMERLKSTSVKYNKSKQKRLREELAKIATEDEELKSREAEKKRIHEQKMQEIATETKKLQDMAEKLRDRLSKLDAKTSKKKEGSVSTE